MVNRLGPGCNCCGGEICGCCSEDPPAPIYYTFSATPSGCNTSGATGTASQSGGNTCAWNTTLDSIRNVTMTISIDSDTCKLVATATALGELGCTGQVTWESTDTVGGDCQTFDIDLTVTGSSGTMATYYGSLDLNLATSP